MIALEPINSIVLSWLGPFPYAELSTDNRASILYMIVGKKKYGKVLRVLYIGLTKRTAQKRLREHRNSSDKTTIRWDTVEIWIGNIHHPTDCNAATLGLAEHYLIHYAQPPLNIKKLIRPSQIACLVSQWRKKNGNPYLQKPAVHTSLPDVIWWDKSHWRYGNLSVIADK